MYGGRSYQTGGSAIAATMAMEDIGRILAQIVERLVKIEEKLDVLLEDTAELLGDDEEGSQTGEVLDGIDVNSLKR